MDLLGSLFVVLGSSLIGVAANELVSLLRRRRIREAEEDPGKRLQRRIELVNAAFSEAGMLLQELQKDLEAQQATRTALIEEAKRQQELLAVNEEQAEKIRSILTHETKATIRAERRQQLAYFLAGVLVSAILSIPIGIWVNSIS
ncbi:hypothetical protein [Nonomuraea rubra]|uniref:Type II secretory pathway component PulJ n=1 Tax=Nonomuraea rubra TaxID=46180 RepID=A0A7X0P932_9ACTN|nr:hypothetical protein [Nonomuraea rubra]MBB6557272.1 type II secretory pathway component PulJ [Nonomuraea rubra]